MKTKSTFYPGIKKMIVSGLISFLMVVNVTAQVNDQLELKETNKNGFLKLNSISGMTSLSGIGFGLRFSPMAGFSINKKTSVSLGPVLKVEKPHYSGYLIKARYMAMKADDSFSGSTFLYFFGSFEKMKNQYFSDKWNSIEVLTSRHTKNRDFDFKDVKFDGYEIAGGFAIGHQLNKRLSLNMEFGVSIYKTKRLNYETIKLYHQPKGFTMHLGLTMRYNLKRN